MWLKLLGFFFGGKSPIEALTDTYVRYKDSVDLHEQRIAEEAKSKRDALIAEQQAAVLIRRETAGFWEMRLLTALTLGGFVFHVLLVILDTCFATIDWRIPKLPAPMDEWEGAIILSLFGIAAAQRSVMAVAAAIAVRKR